MRAAIRSCRNRPLPALRFPRSSWAEARGRAAAPAETFDGFVGGYNEADGLWHCPQGCGYTCEKRQGLGGHKRQCPNVGAAPRTAIERAPAPSCEPVEPEAFEGGYKEADGLYHCPRGCG